MAITQLQPFNLDSTANYTFANITTTNANLGNATTANFFIGSGNNLSNIQGANVTGAVSSATTAATVTTNAQPNITSVGTLTSLSVSGNATIGGNLITSGAGGGNITGANVVSANLFTGTLTTNAQPNITSVGTLTSVSVSGNATIGNLSVSGVVNTNLIPVGNGVQSLGNATNQWSNLFLTGNTIYLGNATISSNASSIVLTTPAGGQTVIAGNTGNSDISGQTLSITGNATIGNIISSGTGGNITGANVISANLLTGTLTTAVQPNITSTGTLASMSVSGNANIGNIGTAGLITATGNLNAGNVITGGIVSATGNITANFYIGNGSQLTGLSTSGVSNGNSNVSIATANGNVTISSAGNTTLTITGTGANVAGTLSVSGNASFSNLTSNGTGGNITGANVISANTISVSGNATIGNIVSSGSGGNITGANVISANLFTGTLTTAAQPNITSTGTLASLSVTGNINAGNVAATTFTGALSGAATSATTAGTVTTAAQPNITSTGTLTSLSVSGTSNLGAVGNVTITGGSSGQVLSTNGSGGLSFISVSSSGISNGNSNVNIATANGNVTITSVGNTTMTVTGTGANISGTLSVSGNAAFANLTSNGTGGNITGANVISANTISVSGNATIGNIVSSGTGGNITGANVISANLFTGTLTTAAQPNITSVGTLASLTINSAIGLGGATYGNSGQVLTSAGSGAVPTWTTPNIASATYVRTSFTATASQTTFTVAYTVGYAEVFLNGVLLNSTDYTASNGTTIVLGVGATLNDIVEVIAYNVTSLGTATLATNIAGGSAGVIPYQTGPNVTGFTAAGTAGQVLTSNGTSAPTWATSVSSQWVTSGSNIYYSAGYASIGTTAPATVNAVLSLYNPSANSSQIYLQNTGTGTGSANGFRLLMAATDVYMTNKENGPIIFETNDTERARIPATGGIQSDNCVSVGAATPSTSGAGITFPATQSASSDANTLDDYEEGTWTPTLRGDSTAGTYTVANIRAYYTKIGNQVTCWAQFTLSAATGGSGYAQFGGLPFSYKASSAITGAIQLNSVNIGTYNYVTLMADSGSAATTMSAQPTTNNTGGSNSPIGAYSTSSVVTYCITYTVS